MGGHTRRDGLVLAVDGGGMKTDLALLDSSGALLAHVRGGRTQFHYLGVDGCIAVLEGLLSTALERAGLDPQAPVAAATAQLLLAGIDIPEELASLRAALERLGWSEHLVVGNDTEALLRSGTERGWGAAVVCGTGINCLGVAQDGREARFLSFGLISGDWGGGGDIGVAALAAAVRAADGRGPRSVLQTAVPAHFGLTDPYEVARAVHLEELPAGRLGELTPLVLAARGQDAVAAEIVQRLAAEVVAFVRAALQRLELVDADPDVVLGGRVLRSVAADVIEMIVDGVHRVAPRARIVVSASEPIVGAALLGLDAVGAGPAARARARAELDRAIAGV
ncbi:MAG TPA: BadF/BadG/BcrA/BcrD ATPase family protein [Solirubrobacteraceae bacterium]|nr:BadF/BadG/BcrA/BcrD ATPase family protein [Solirubrobacteraceae bacterium]